MSRLAVTLSGAKGLTLTEQDALTGRRFFTPFRMTRSGPLHGALKAAYFPGNTKAPSSKRGAPWRKSQITSYIVSLFRTWGIGVCLRFAIWCLSFPTAGVREISNHKGHQGCTSKMKSSGLVSQGVSSCPDSSGEEFPGTWSFSTVLPPLEGGS